MSLEIARKVLQTELEALHGPASAAKAGLGLTLADGLKPVPSLKWKGGVSTPPSKTQYGWALAPEGV